MSDRQRSHDLCVLDCRQIVGGHGVVARGVSLRSTLLESLVADGRWNLIALSRNPQGGRAQALLDRGVDVRGADLDDRASLMAAFAEACIANDIQHLVMSTVLYVEEGQEEKLDYIRPKYETEQYVTEKGIPYTFIRPASFMDEIGGEYLPVKKGVVTGQADNDAKVPYVATRDIGRLAVMAFADPESFIGQRINLIGDFLSGDELAAVLTGVTGKPHRHKAPPIPLMWIFAREWIPLRRQFESWGRPPHPVAMLEGLEESRRLLPDILTFEDYLRSTGFGMTSAVSA